MASIPSFSAVTLAYGSDDEGNLQQRLSAEVNGSLFNVVYDVRTAVTFYGPGRSYANSYARTSTRIGKTKKLSIYLIPRKRRHASLPSCFVYDALQLVYQTSSPCNNCGASLQVSTSEG